MLTVTFAMVAALLVVVFVVVYLSVRDQMRQAVTANLESSQRLVSAIQARQERELRSQAENLSENPTLKAALDTFSAEAPSGDEATRGQLLKMIQREIGKVAERFDSDALVLVDTHDVTLASAGRLAERWPTGHLASVSFAPGDREHFQGVVHIGKSVFRVIAVPQIVNDSSVIGTLYVATSLDQHYADDLKEMSRADTAILSDGLLIASTLPPPSAREIEGAIARNNADGGTLNLGGESLAYRRLVQIDHTALYALASIDEASGAGIRESARSLALIAAGAVFLGLLGSVTLAHRLTEPIGHLSASIARMATSRDVSARLSASGSSLELDALTATFNALMTSLESAEAQTQAAYTGAIRALAAALDARDPYTAGHSDRVSVLSVAIGRALQLPQDEIEVIRLGALLHDIGKIGIPDEILRKAGPLTAAEYGAIKEHPGLGARILRPVPFLTRHVSIVELHHERPDGRGYPHGLRGSDIPLAARVVHVADAYDAMTSARAYRGARPPGEALQELWRCSGTEFDAEIVGALANALPGLTDQDGVPAATEMACA